MKMTNLPYSFDAQNVSIRSDETEMSVHINMVPDISNSNIVKCPKPRLLVLLEQQIASATTANLPAKVALYERMKQMFLDDLQQGIFASVAKVLAEADGKIAMAIESSLSIDNELLAS